MHYRTYLGFPGKSTEVLVECIYLLKFSDSPATVNKRQSNCLQKILVIHDRGSVTSM